MLPPPPIKIVGIQEYSSVKSILKEASISEEYTIKFLGSETWSVNSKNEDIFRNVTEKLNDNGVQWYSHANKNSRNIKVICKGLPPSMPIEEIVEDLTNRGFKIKAATCMIKKSGKNTAEGT